MAPDLPLIGRVIMDTCHQDDERQRQPERGFSTSMTPFPSSLDSTRPRKQLLGSLNDKSCDNQETGLRILRRCGHWSEVTFRNPLTGRRNRFRRGGVHRSLD